MTVNQQEWIQATAKAAGDAGHIWPQMAAAEAALESNYGQSALAREANNLFGMKNHSHAQWGTVSLPTKEFLDGEWITTTAEWMKYDTLADCFEDRMATLKRLSAIYPHYSAALSAPDAYTYVTQVSSTWSTDPERATKVIAIYGEYFRTGSNAGDVGNAVTGEG